MLVLSLSSFHGRGFFPPQIGLGDPLAVVACCEAVIGLFIELILIVTFSKRFLKQLIHLCRGAYGIHVYIWSRPCG
jgi:hypothetical protein